MDFPEIGLDTSAARLDPVLLPAFEAAGLEVFLKREDLIGSHLTGNKWRKLKYNLWRARELGHRRLLTFGGAYSNQVRAVAEAGQRFGFSTIGIIRGEERLPLNPVLACAKQVGMQLHWIDRTSYRERKTEPDFLASLENQFGSFYLLPEGGTNELCLPGCAEIIGEIEIPFDVVACACGTGGTLAGLLTALTPKQSAIGIAVLKNGGFLTEDIRALLGKKLEKIASPWRVETDHHAGGYAKRPTYLLDWIEEFHRSTGIELDPIYTGKMMLGLSKLAESGAFDRGTRIVAIHTGGILPKERPEE